MSRLPVQLVTTQGRVTFTAESVQLAGLVLLQPLTTHFKSTVLLREVCMARLLARLPVLPVLRATIVLDPQTP